jgi:putative transposase
MRKRRELYGGAEYHVTARINRGEYILEPKEIKELYLHVIKRAKKKYVFMLRNFSIMDNHVHLLLTPGKNESLSKIMQWIQSVSAVQINKKYNLQGHVWYDRFKSKVLRSYKQLLATFSYICNNPVKAEMVDKPEEYVFGGLWFIRHRWFYLVEPPDTFIKQLLPEFFEQKLITDTQ